MQPRMNNPAISIPGAMEALQALAASVEGSGVPRRTLDVVELRASQINGCGVCLHGHALAAKEAGETDERLFALAGWRDAPYFTDAERAALALTEAVTRLSDRPTRFPTRSGTTRRRCTTSRLSRRSSSPLPASTSGTG